MENWASIAAEVAGAIASVGFTATITRPYEILPYPDPEHWTPDVFDVTVIDDQIRIRDASGATTGETRRVLTIGATGLVPVRGDWVTVRGEKHRIGQVAALAPGGVDILFECTLEA